MARQDLLLYRPEWEEARQRLTRWWKGEDIGRAVLQITAPRSEPAEPIEEVAAPPDCVCPTYTTADVAFRVNQAQRQAAGTHYLGEAIMGVAPGDIGPNCLAAFLGCRVREMPRSPGDPHAGSTAWFEPCLAEAVSAAFGYARDNFYWRFCRQSYERALNVSRGRFLLQFPDLIEGLDTLAAMRGSQRLLVDLIDRPQWVYDCLDQITQLYFRYYDMLHDLIRDEVGGSVFWCWAPGRLVKLQCDFSAMISRSTFRDFMLPVLKKMTERLSYSLYHWDGPGALHHLEALLSLPDLDMIQWTPGAGQEPPEHRRWWPVYHQIVGAGKRVMIGVGGATAAQTKKVLLALKREFGPYTQSFMMNLYVQTPAQGQECLRLMEL